MPPTMNKHRVVFLCFCIFLFGLPRNGIISAHMAITPGTRIGAYEVTSQLGEGGMGVVYRARDTKLLRDAALKVLPEHFADDPNRLSLIKREAELLEALNPDNIT